MNDCKLYLVRHGESAANRDGVVGGHIDTPLTELGLEQAKATKQVLGHVKFDAVYSSDLTRALDTAKIISGRDVPPANRLPELRERHFGRLEGQPAGEWLEIDKAYTERYSSLPFEERFNHPQADFIESDKTLLERIDGALRRIAQAHQGQTVLVGLHGGPIRVMLMHLGYAPFLPANSFQNSGYIVLSGNGDGLRVEKAVGVVKPSGTE